MRHVFAVAAVALVAACGGNTAPELEPPSFSPASVTPGDEVVLIALAKDPDADIANGKAVVTTRVAGAATGERREVPLSRALADDETVALLKVGVSAPSAASVTFLVDLVVLDAAGNASNMQTVELTTSRAH
jgi:hypothetical protein